MVINPMVTPITADATTAVILITASAGGEAIIGGITAAGAVVRKALIVQFLPGGATCG